MTNHDKLEEDFLNMKDRMDLLFHVETKALQEMVHISHMRLFQGLRSYLKNMFLIPEAALQSVVLDAFKDQEKLFKEKIGDSFYKIYDHLEKELENLQNTLRDES